MKKVCSSCKNEKDLGSFSKDKTRADGRQPRCKECVRNKYRSDYTLKYRDKIRIRDKSNRDKNVALLLEYRLAHPCIKCGETDPVCLDFHHVDPSTKEFSVSQEVQRSWSKLSAEIDKCIVLCSNCHRKLHAGRFEL